MNEISKILNDNEKIIWEGKPQFLPFIIKRLGLIGCVIVPLTLFAVVALVQGDFFIAIMFLLALSILLTAALFGPFLTYRKIFYTITDKRVITQSGIIGSDFNMIDFDKIQSMSVNVGLIDKLFGNNTGTISIYSGTVSFVNNGTAISYPYSLEYVENAYQVFEKLKKVSHDVKTDIEYPNDMRPKKNSGYNTEYKS